MKFQKWSVCAFKSSFSISQTWYNERDLVIIPNLVCAEKTPMALISNRLENPFKFWWVGHWQTHNRSKSSLKTLFLFRLFMSFSRGTWQIALFHSCFVKLLKEGVLNFTMTKNNLFHNGIMCETTIKHFLVETGLLYLPSCTTRTKSIVQVHRALTLGDRFLKTIKHASKLVSSLPSQIANFRLAVSIS